MSTYRALHRASSKRSISRRAQIFVIASLLVPISLLTIAKAPVHATASNNPIFATLQDVQDTINAALAPINNAIASLQQQQQAQAQQISSLQNTTGKQLWTLDANGNVLGLLVNHSNGFFNGVSYGMYYNDTIYSTTLNRFIYLDQLLSTSSMHGFNNAIEPLFATPDCSGTAYLEADGTSSVSRVANDVLPYTPTQLFELHTSDAATTVNIQSQGVWNTSNHINCMPLASSLQVLQLYPVSPPFPTPIAFPLQFKYQ